MHSREGGGDGKYKNARQSMVMLPNDSWTLKFPTQSTVWSGIYSLGLAMILVGGTGI